MKYKGIARIDKKTKNLVKRLKPGDIAIIDHQDLDEVTAESLIESKVEVVVNASPSISGKYPNTGPLLLTSAGIHLIDSVGKDVLTMVKEGDEILVHGASVVKDNQVIARGKVLTPQMAEEAMEKARKNLGAELERFAANTLDFLQKEKGFLEGLEIPKTRVDLEHRHALIVSRGYDYKEDLKTLKAYIEEFKPVLIGVDGGADALLEAGYRPDIIIGDMDSVSDEGLKCGAELIVHAYRDGRAPGIERLKGTPFRPLIFKSAGTSEDVAMLLAHEKGVELIVAVGSHANLIEFLDKGRKGMASTFLVRLRIGSKLVDAKGVNKLYRATVKPYYLLVVILAAMLTILIIIQASPALRDLIRLLALKIRLSLGL
ncbi:MAG: putative cytokinetic ring protein SteA [Actinomycetota bacterium]